MDTPPSTSQGSRAITAIDREKWSRSACDTALVGHDLFARPSSYASDIPQRESTPMPPNPVWPRPAPGGGGGTPVECCRKQGRLAEWRWVATAPRRRSTSPFASCRRRSTTRVELLIDRSGRRVERSSFHEALDRPCSRARTTTILPSRSAFETRSARRGVLDDEAVHPGRRPTAVLRPVHRVWGLQESITAIPDRSRPSHCDQYFRLPRQDIGSLREIAAPHPIVRSCFPVIAASASSRGQRARVLLGSRRAG